MNGSRSNNATRSSCREARHEGDIRSIAGFIGTRYLSNFWHVLPLVLMAHVCFSQQLSATSSAQDAHEAQLERRVFQEVEDYAKWKSALLNNKQELESLRQQTKLPDRSLGGQAESARETLAKFGDSEQIVQVACEFYSYSVDNFAQFAAAQKLQRIGGFASIRLLAEIMLDPANHSYVAVRKMSQSPARLNALKALAKLVPELGIPIQVSMAGSAVTEEQVRTWYDWLGAHREELSKLQPSDISIPSRSDCSKIRGVNLSSSDVISLDIVIASAVPAPTRPRRYKIVNRGDRFFLGKHEVNEASINDLFSALSSPLSDPLTLADLGLDDNWLVANANAALQFVSAAPATSAFGKQPEELNGSERQQFLMLFSDNNRMNDILEGCLLIRTNDHPSVQVTIRLKDAQIIRLSALGSGPFLLPWEIQSQSQVETPDHRISLAIAALLPKDAPNIEQLSSSGSYDLRRQLALELADYIKKVCNSEGCPKLQE